MNAVDRCAQVGVRPSAPGAGGNAAGVARPDSAYAWWRLLASLALSTMGGIGLWSVVVVAAGDPGRVRGRPRRRLAALHRDHGRLRRRRRADGPPRRPLRHRRAGRAGRAHARHRLRRRGERDRALAVHARAGAADRHARQLRHLRAAGRRCVALVCPRRGIAVAIVASGNYLAGTIWPPLLQAAIEAVGWRQAHVGIGVLCVLTMLPLALVLRRRAPVEDAGVPLSARAITDTLRMSPATLQALLVVAGLFVLHRDVDGAGAPRRLLRRSRRRGRRAAPRCSRSCWVSAWSAGIASGLIADRIGGVGTLILGSTLQCLALLFYLPFDGLTSLGVVSALFGLSQGGIVPSYALIVRDYFPAREAGARVSLVLMATVAGMALGGWMSGAIFDLTGSYRAAFLNGIAWNFCQHGDRVLASARPPAPAPHDRCSGKRQELTGYGLAGLENIVPSLPANRGNRQEGLRTRWPQPAVVVCAWNADLSPLVTAGRTPATCGSDVGTTRC